MSEPQKENQQAKLAGGIIHWFFTFVKTIVFQVVGSASAILNVWPIKQIFQYFAGKQIDKIENRLEDAATKVIIKEQIKKELETSNDKEAQLKKAIESGDQDAIKRAEKEYDDSIDDLVHYNGSHSS